jgi:sphinganine-1-phosphate aldolase
MRSLPDHGEPIDRIERRLDGFLDLDPHRRHVALSLGIHYVSDEIQDVLRRAHNRFAHHDNYFVYMRPGSHAIERDVLAIAEELLGGGDSRVTADFCASGTEATVNALFAARQWARATKPHIRRPEVVAPFSAHNVLTKAATYLDLTVVRAPLRDDLHADLDALEGLIGPDTIAIMGSAPNLAFGYYDDIPRLGRLALEHDLWLHIDATIGGFLAPFVTANGEHVPQWDFSVPGVRSMSAAFDKWAYAMKPAAVVAWRDLETKQHALVTTDDWPLESATSTGIGGGRSGGPVAAVWAVFHHLGREGYQLLASHLTEGQREYARRLADIPGITVIEPGFTVLNFVHETLSPDSIILAMHQRGWRHFACKAPPMVTLNFDAASIDVMDEYVSDLTAVVRELSCTAPQRALRLVSPPER